MAMPTAASCIRTKIFPSASATNSCRPRWTARNGGRAPSRPASRCRRRTRASCCNKIAEGTWICGDPGMQYDGAIQKWHTCKGTEPIHSTNPCSEYVFLNNTACNLASLNLMKFKRDDGKFDVERFKAAVRILHHRAGNPRGQRQLSDQGHRRKFPHLPHARPRFRQSRFAHHELRFAV